MRLTKFGFILALAAALLLPAALAAQESFDENEERGIAITRFDNLTRTGQITFNQVIRALDAIEQPYILTDVDVRSVEDAVQLADDTNAVFTLDGYERNGSLYFVINWGTRGAQVVLGDPEAVAEDVLEESFVLTADIAPSFAADYIKGSIAYVFGDDPVALDHLSAAYNALPRGSEVASQAIQLFSSYAVLLNRYQDYETALSVNEFVFDIDPNFDFGYYTKARSLRFINRFEEALEAIETALSLDDDNSSYFSEKGRIFILMDRFDEAAAAYETALEQDPSNAVAVVGLGDVAYFSGDIEGSIDYYNQALEIDPTYTYALYSRAYSYKDLNQPELAVDDLLAALEIDPDYLDVLQTLGDVYFILGDTRNARLRYQEYLDKGGQPQDYILDRLGN